jgi:hypothetical protein
MNSHVEQKHTTTSTLRLSPLMWLALDQLLQAHDAASSAQRPLWDFAVEIHFLYKTGISHSDVRYLICQGLVEHAAEITRPVTTGRAFSKLQGLRLLAESCFVLSDQGLDICRNMAEHKDDAHVQTNNSHLDTVPRWDGTRRQLRFGDAVVKHFRQPARNQETVLAAFEEEGWPAHIDDPLSGDTGQDGLERLHNTIKRLNHQPVRLLHFSADGAGQGVVWQQKI